MVKQQSLSPFLFLFLEFFILIPSIVFVLGVLQQFFFQNNEILQMITPENALFQNIFVTILSPFVGGFFAYQYLERNKPKGLIALKAKGIIFYSIILVGLVICYQFFITFVR